MSTSGIAAGAITGFLSGAATSRLFDLANERQPGWLGSGGAGKSDPSVIATMAVGIPTIAMGLAGTQMALKVSERATQFEMGFGQALLKQQVGVKFGVAFAPAAVIGALAAKGVQELTGD